MDKGVEFKVEALSDEIDSCLKVRIDPVTFVAHKSHVLRQVIEVLYSALQLAPTRLLFSHY